MKEIVPVNVWYNGASIQANYLQLYCMNDNLVDTAIFYYALIYLDASSTEIPNIPKQLNQGQLTMTGSSYETDWTTNDQAWNWAATQMNLSFV